MLLKCKGCVHMFKNRQFIAITIISLFGIILFYIGTDGFQAFTAETARTNKLLETQPLMPEVTLEDSKGREYGFSEFEGKYIMMTYIYTRCSTVCPQLEKNLAEVYEEIPENYLGEDIVFLSFIFDSYLDTPEILVSYINYYIS